MFRGGVKIKAIEQVLVLFILNFKNVKAAERGDGFTRYTACCFKMSAEEEDGLHQCCGCIGFSADPDPGLMSQNYKNLQLKIKTI
jgi:hypothetical protein